MQLFDRGQWSVGRFLALVMLLFSFSSEINALTVLHVPAVDANGQGILTTIQADVKPGTGGVYVDVQPFISVDTQNSAKTAATVAAKLAGVDLSHFDVFYKIIANTESVDGPSGGQALALLAYAEFTHKTLRSDLTATGTIEADGNIGKVGGILEKVQAAQQAGVKLVLLPLGQSIQNGVDLTQYAESRWGMQVVEVHSLNDSVALAFTAVGSHVAVTPHPQVSLVLGNVTSLQTDSVLPLKALAQDQVQTLKSTLSQEDPNSVIAQEIRQAIKRSSYLLSNGYYYSAANEAFLAQIQADSYAMSNWSKNDLAQKIDDLQSHLSQYRFAPPTAANLEWSAGARLRWYWAKERLREVNDGLAAADTAEPFLEDFSASENWFLAAQLLDAQARSMAGGAAVEMDAWKAYAIRQINLANQTVAKNPLDSESFFHLNAGKLALNDGDYLAASYDAGFAVAFSSATGKMSQMTDASIPSFLPQPSGLVQFSDSAWSQLYFSHALFNAEQANQSGDLSDLFNTVKLESLAGVLKQVRNDLVQRIGAPIESVGSDGIINSANGVLISAQMQPSGVTWPLVAVAVLAALVLAALVWVFAGRPRDLSMRERADLVERGFLEGRISEKTYDKLNRKYGVGATGSKKKNSR